MLDWLSQSTIYGPSRTLNAVAKRAVVNAVFLRHLLHRCSLAVICDPVVHALIIVLLFVRAPAAILRAVIAVVVDAFQRHPGRWFPHVGQEVPKVAPTFADGDAAAAIVAVPCGFWIRASLNHTFPSAINARFMAPVFEQRGAGDMDGIFSALFRPTGVTHTASSASLEFPRDDESHLAALRAGAGYFGSSHSQLLLSCDSVRGVAALTRCAPRFIFAQ